MTDHSNKLTDDSDCGLFFFMAVFLRKGEVEHLAQYSRFYMKPGNVVEKHKHTDMTEIFYVESGRGVIRINDEDSVLEPGVYVSVPPGSKYE